MSIFAEIFTTSLTPMVFLYMAVGVLSGICIGALPGLTATMGVAPPNRATPHGLCIQAQ